MKIEDPNTWHNFREQVRKSIQQLEIFLNEMNAQNKLVLGYGASTKGNVILQKLSPKSVKSIKFMLERDPNKYGKFTPGTNIEIISEQKGREMNPDVLLVMPWHFKSEIIEREKKFIERGGKLVFPLPNFSIINGENFATSKK